MPWADRTDAGSEGPAGVDGRPTMRTMTARFEFDAELWRWRARDGWFFVTLPSDAADEIDERFGGSTAGFGSLPVEVNIGGSSWTTSIFPSKEEESYVLPIKQAVRKAEQLDAGVTATVVVSIVVD